ncbi:MAG: TrkH family potassium uptake protein [Rhodobacteraceae bacterium]|uniref:TrkH family potassium uptake protein n=1 Tax=Marivita sp. TaxID=2003365 RepID=UPI003B5260DE|nr:TrkH family potassium uptake protein [Paracoccaceae bacterium]
MNGQASVAWTARPGAVMAAVLSQAHVVGMVLALPFAVALAEQAWPLVRALGLPLLAVVIAALCATRVTPPRDLRGIEAAAVLVMLFVGVAALAVPAYMMLGLPLVDAIFESVSAITSTGLTVASGTMDWPLTGHALRGWMQWAGGFAIAVAGVALILGPVSARSTASTLGRTGIDDQDILSSTRVQARRLLVVYGALTGIAVLGFMPLFPTWWEAVAIALTAVSTGGFTPRPDSLESYSRMAQVATMIVCVATTVSLMAYIVFWRDGMKKALTGTNARLVLGGIALATVLAFVLALASGASFNDAVDATINMVSGVTTAGFSVGDPGAIVPVMAAILAAMVVGGGSGSTAGGVKAERVATLGRMVGVALLRMKAPPGAVMPLKENSRRVDAAKLVALGAVLCLYAASMLIVWALLCLGGIDPMSALFDTVSALSTVGLSLGATGPDLAWPLKLVLAAAMLLGRLEFVTLIAVLSPGTWAPFHR